MKIPTKSLTVLAFRSFFTKRTNISQVVYKTTIVNNKYIHQFNWFLNFFSFKQFLV